MMDLAGHTDFTDVGGQPVFVASAILGDSVQPCKAAPHLQPGSLRSYLLSFGWFLNIA